MTLKGSSPAHVSRRYSISCWSRCASSSASIGINHDEYRQAVAFMLDTAQKGEIPLLMDVLLEATVDQVDSDGRTGTASSVEGPFYVANAPEMKSPAVLPHRTNEPGEVLFLSGRCALPTDRRSSARSSTFGDGRRGQLLTLQHPGEGSAFQSARACQHRQAMAASRSRPGFHRPTKSRTMARRGRFCRRPDGIRGVPRTCISGCHIPASRHSRHSSS